MASICPANVTNLSWSWLPNSPILFASSASCTSRHPMATVFSSAIRVLGSGNYNIGAHSTFH